jgi:hypothetical protein
MGRLTEYFEYLKTPPKDLKDFKEKLCHISIKEEDNVLRKKLKLYIK